MSESDRIITKYKKIIEEYKKENIALRNRVKSLEQAIQKFKDSISEDYTK
ncbi:hypothetical protein OAK17_01060 [Alphaproteobacteria bacterium]|nr:hypothetical protein [Alphaproteobacteria bacterium]